MLNRLVIEIIFVLIQPSSVVLALRQSLGAPLAENDGPILN